MPYLPFTLPQAYSMWRTVSLIRRSELKEATRDSQLASPVTKTFVNEAGMSQWFMPDVSNMPKPTLQKMICRHTTVC